MKLSTTLVSRELARHHRLSVLGTTSARLRLRRPELLERGTRDLEPGHLYVGRCEQLPQRPTVGSGATVVVCDRSPRLRWFRERCCVIVVEDEPAVERVFNEVQGAYLRYDLWEETLYNVVADDASIPALLEASGQVLEGSLVVVGPDFRLLALSGGNGPEEGTGPIPVSDEAGNLNPLGMSEFLAEHEMETSRRDPFQLEVSGLSTFNQNLYDGDEYLGCLALVARPGRACDEADAPVLAFLSTMVIWAMRRLAVSPDAFRGSLRPALRTLVENGPLDARSLASLAAARGSYVCVKIRPGRHATRLPPDYVRNVVEAQVPDTVTFVHEGFYVVAFVRLDGLAPEGGRRAELERRLVELSRTIGAKMGVSDHLLGLESARTYYLQAGIALENGMAMDPERSVFRFQDYALPELLLNALGELSVEAYYTPGLRRLFSHDENSAVSYVDTLEALLAHDMNVTRTARDLFVHRSTLIERLGHIREAMSGELDDPDDVLRIRVALAARRLEQRLKA